MIVMHVLMCVQCKVSLSDGWTTSCDDTSSSVHHRHHVDYEDERDGISVVFDMKRSAALSNVSSSDVRVINCLVMLMSLNNHHSIYFLEL